MTTPIGLLGVPFVDQTFGYQANLGNQPHDTNLTYTGYFTGDLLGIEGAAYLALHRGNEALIANQTSTPELRLTLSRHDPDAELLGPLHARSVALGSITVPSVPNVLLGSPTGNGVFISNRPLDQPTSFDRQNLRGNLPPGWDVTLCYNDALVAYQQSRSDGQYAFDDLPLSFGPNEFRLVFNGPLGQVRVERRSFLLDHSIIKPGEVFYSVVQQQADGNTSKIDGGSMRSVAQVDVGITRGVSVNGALVRKPDLTTGEEMGFGQVGLRAYLDMMILSAQLTKSQGSGLLAELDAKTRLAGYSVDLTHLQRQGDFQSDVLDAQSNAIRFRDTLRVVGAYRPDHLPPLSLALNAQRDQLANGGEQIDVTGRVSTMVKGTSVSNTLDWQSTTGSSTVQGVLQLSRRVMDVGLNGLIGYEVAPHASVQSLSLTADRALSDAYRINAGIQRTITSSPLTLLSLGLTKNLGAYGLGLSTSYSSHRELTIGVQLFISLGREPRSGAWLLDAQPLAGTGAVSARAFVDRNLNGVRDPGEELIPNAGFIFNGGGRHPSRTGSNGTDFIGRLPPGQYTDIALDPDTLEDPQWRPMTPGVRVLPRPGVVDIIEFPVVATSEIDGTVYLLDKAGRREIGDARLELVDAMGAVVMATKSSPDGYYLLHQVIPGKYSIRIAPDQATKLGLGGVLDRPVTVPPDGDFINGQDLELKLVGR
ncbi:MAG: carboxypeptidase-like regulatory domain-containing protein [Caldimonas sp.]